MSLKLKFGKRKIPQKQQKEKDQSNHNRQHQQQFRSNNYTNNHQQDYNNSSIPSVSKTPVFTLASKKKNLNLNNNTNVNKQSTGNVKNIYDKIRSNNNIQEENQNVGGSGGNINFAASSKPMLNLRPNLGKKNNIKILPPKNSQVQRQKQQQISQAGYNNDNNSQPVPKPTPLFKGKGRHLGIGLKNHSKQRQKSRQKVIVNQQQQYEASYGQPQQKNNNYRQQEDQAQQSVHLRPDLKRKHKVDLLGNKKSERSGNQNNNQNDFQKSQQQSQSEQYNHKTSYIPMSIQATQINLKPSIPQVSQAKIQKQRIRTKQLKNLLNLEIDLYQDFISISEVTKYEVYINKIKGGILKNSMDQAFDQRTNQSVQTLPFDFDDFGNQCPQDYRINMIGQGKNRVFDSQNMETIKTDQSQALNAFVLKVAPIIQELIRPSSSVVMPPVFLLAFRPNFRKFMACPHPVFIYQAQNIHNNFSSYGIVVIGQKLYISPQKINSVLSLRGGSYLIGGLDSGRIVLWTGKNDKSSRLYEQIYTLIQSTNFELPQYVNNDLQRNSIYSSQNKIVSLQQIQKNAGDFQFYSLDQSGKLIYWRIEEDSHKNVILKGVKGIDFSLILQKKALIAYELKIRHSQLFISTSRGILVYTQGEQITQIQRLQNQNLDIISFELPKRSNFVYTIYSNKTFVVFDQNYSKELFSIQIETLSEEAKLNKIVVPDLQHEYRQISLLSIVYVTDTQGNVYQINLLTQKVRVMQENSEPFMGTNTQSSILNSKNNKNKKNSGVIFKGIHNLPYNQNLQVITLWNDLKCTKNFIQMNVCLQKSIPNLKKIIQENRKVHSLLEMDYAIM